MRQTDVRESKPIDDGGRSGWWRTRGVRFKNIHEAAGFLRKMADRASTDIAIREKALKIIFPAAPARDQPEQALVIAEWVKENIRYVSDPKESFERPETTLRLGAGDCDAQTVLVCSFLGAVGIKNKMCLLNVGGRWIHIFPVAMPKTKDGLHRMTLDTTIAEPIRDLVNPIEKITRAGKVPRVLMV